MNFTKLFTLILVFLWIYKTWMDFFHISAKKKIIAILAERINSPALELHSMKFAKRLLHVKKHRDNGFFETTFPILVIVAAWTLCDFAVDVVDRTYIRSINPLVMVKETGQPFDRNENNSKSLPDRQKTCPLTWSTQIELSNVLRTNCFPTKSKHQLNPWFAHTKNEQITSTHIVVVAFDGNSLFNSCFRGKLKKTRNAVNNQRQTMHHTLITHIWLTWKLNTRVHFFNTNTCSCASRSRYVSVFVCIGVKRIWFYRYILYW